MARGSRPERDLRDRGADRGRPGTRPIPSTASWPRATAACSAGSRSAPIAPPRRCYAGVAEVSAYVAAEARGGGLSDELLAAVISSSSATASGRCKPASFPRTRPSLRLPGRFGFRIVGTHERIGRLHGVWRRRCPGGTTKRGGHMTKVEAVVMRERVETVIDAVEEQTGHVGVTVVEAVGHGRQRGITHEYRGRVFESASCPRRLLTFVVADDSRVRGRRDDRRRRAQRQRVGRRPRLDDPGRARHPQPHGPAARSAWRSACKNAATFSSPRTRSGSSSRPCS